MAPPEAKCIEDQMVQVKEVRLLLSGTTWPLNAIAGSNALLAILARSTFHSSRRLRNEGPAACTFPYVTVAVPPLSGRASLKKLALGLPDVKMSAPLCCQQYFAVAYAWHLLCMCQIMKAADSSHLLLFRMVAGSST